MFDLLQHRVGQAAHISIATEKQDRQPVGVGHCRRRHHVGGAGSGRCRCKHEAAAEFLLGIGHSGECHGLFVLAAPQGQFIAVFIQGFAKANHIAMAENAKAAAAQALFHAIDFDKLVGKMADKGLRRGQANGAGRVRALYNSSRLDVAR